MKIKAKRLVQLNGHIFAVGEATDYDGPVTGHITHNFEMEDGSPISAPPKGDDTPPPPQEKTTTDAERIEAVLASLGIDGVRRRLDEMNITYPPSANGKRLAKLLLINQGEIEEV